MRHTRVVAATAIWISLVAATAAAAPLGNYQWGASAAAIRDQTGAVPASGAAGVLVKREPVLGREAYVTYRFDSSGLSAVGIQWDEKIFAVVKRFLDKEYGESRCTQDKESCSWKSQSSTVRLVGTPSLGVTLLVFSKRS